jgi:hypothetical protein
LNEIRLKILWWPNAVRIFGKTCKIVLSIYDEANRPAELLDAIVDGRLVSPSAAAQAAQVQSIITVQPNIYDVRSRHLPSIVSTMGIWFVR